MKKTVLTLGIVAAMAGCGGSDFPTSVQPPTSNTPVTPPVTQPPVTQPPVAQPPVTPPPVTGSQTGVLSDAQVAGVSYTTSSGVTGVTDTAGKFNYNPGDTVTFKLGAVQLGTLPGAGLVTPIDLAAGNTNKLTNLLVLLQSLDADGNPANGINIPAAAAGAMPAVDLTSSTSVSAALQTAMTAAQITTPVKTVQDAKSHYLAQALTLLSNNIWVAKDGSKPVLALRVTADGHYWWGAGGGGAGGQPGLETGTIGMLDVDAAGYKLKGTTTVDQNGESGLSNSDATQRFVITDTEIKVRDTAGQSLLGLVKMENDPTGIVGAWLMTDESGVPMSSQLFLFFSSGYAMMVDALGDVPEQGDLLCGGPGIEVGKYSYNAATKMITRQPNPDVNTNGCAGLWEVANDVNPTTIAFELSADGKQAKFIGRDADGEFTANFRRISQ